MRCKVSFLVLAIGCTSVASSSTSPIRTLQVFSPPSVEELAVERPRLHRPRSWDVILNPRGGGGGEEEDVDDRSSVSVSVAANGSLPAVIAGASLMALFAGAGPPKPVCCYLKEP